MGITIDNINHYVFGNRHSVLADVDFDTSYPTGGEPVIPSMFGMSKIEAIFITAKSGYVFEYDAANQKIIAYWCAGSGAAMSQVTNTTDLSALTDVKILVIGV